jgi:hypothetical protein
LNYKVIILIFLTFSCAKVELEHVHKITFKDVKPILERSCLSCHNTTGKASQLPLTRFEHYQANAKNIYKWVKNKKMPPFDPESDGFKFINKEYLQGSEREQLLEFLGSPKLGYTDEVLEVPKENIDEITGDKYSFNFGKGITIPPRGFLYRCYFFKIPERAKGKFLTQLQIKGENKKYIHHNIYHVTSVDSKDELNRYFHPGAGCILPDQNPIIGTGNNTGFFIQDDVNLVVQVHFDRTMDESTKTIIFDKDFELVLGVQEEVETIAYNSVIHVPHPEVVIPYGKTTTTTVTNSVKDILDKSKIGRMLQATNNSKVRLKAFLFHMHLYGKAAELVWEISAEDPKEKRTHKQLLRENNFDSRHQYFGILETPVNLDVKDFLRISCDYDNSAENPRTIFFNPEKKTITGGFSSSSEMCSTYLVFELPYSEFKK